MIVTRRLTMTSADQNSRVELLTRACASTRSILEHVTREQLADPTPCREWLVRHLINHVVGATQFFADLAEQGFSPEDEAWPDYADGDFTTAFGQQVRRAVAGEIGRASCRERVCYVV